MTISLNTKEVQSFVKYFKSTKTFEKLASEYCETFSFEQAKELIFSFTSDNGEFIFNDLLVQDFFIIWVAGKINKRDYILGKGITAVSKGYEKDTGVNMIRLSNIEMFGGGDVGEPVAENKRHDESKCQIDDVVIHCKSDEHAEKIYNAILDR